MGDDEKQNPFTVLVCGGGNAAQVATAMFAARYKTIAVSLYADEAAKWAAALGDVDYELTLDTGKVISSKPDSITNDPSVAANADAIVLAVPSFAHGQYFEAFEPYIKPDTVVACMPARSGGDILLAAKLGKKAEDVIFVGFETLPWACRFTDWGKKATILGTKGSILAAVTPPAKRPKAFAALQGLLGVFPNVAASPNNLGISLRNPGAVIHPGVMYGRWCSEKWDGQPLTEKPLFYQGVEEFSEDVLLKLTGEVQLIKKKMEELIPGLDLKDAVDLKQWYLDCYAGQMTDTSSLRGCMNTNPGYKGLTHPMKEENGKYMPDLKYRYLSEDVPTGMCFNKGLAEILGIDTPMTDKVLEWAQNCIGMKFIENGKMCGADVVKSRAPQATGITTLDAFLTAAKIDKAALSKVTKAAPAVPPPAESEEKNPFCVVVCGGGNAAQVASAMYAARYNTIAVSLYADEAAKWKAALGDDKYELTLDTGKKILSKIDDITNDPSVAAKADAIVLAVPSFAHGQYFEAFAPYMKPNCVVAVMPARSGGDILFSAKLGAKAKDMVFVGFETLPWACRFTEWGRKATILGTKGSILAAVTPPTKVPLAFAVMQGLLGVFPNVAESPSNLGISLRNPGAVIHPGVMYGRWCPEKWDGKPMAEKPLFYQGVEEFSESVLLGLTGEVQLIKKKMEALIPGLDLKDACDLKQWYMDSYAGQMTDTSSLRMCMNTNPGYRGLTHPMKEEDGKYMPDLKYRYLAEDVPTGMCFNKGLAEILGISTPMTDKVLEWAQGCIGLKILEGGKMCGADVGKTRAPQATGITTLEAFCQAASIAMGASSIPASLDVNRTFKVVFLRHGESVWNVANIFTGWADVDLSPAGEQEAVEAGKCLKEKGFKFDIVFTSLLRRSIKTAWTALSYSENFSMPIINSWRLNERHYGALQGLNKAETAAKHGDAQVKIWRRSYDIPPPPIDINDSRHPANDPLYRNVPSAALPGAESLKLTVDRVLPFWFDSIGPCVMAGRSVLVAAHGNSLRAICKYLENMSEKEVLELNIPTSVPLVYELDGNLNFIKKYYLMDPDEVAKKMAAVAAQGSAKK
mmetsp:Transcript_21049/g.66518  ORF Transcript_21049/g.66518 Transcript_21049/m.66518 type:complete len:1086 (+) Transcript_21049:64-3321(+)